MSKLLTVNEVAELLRVSKAMAYKLLDQGDIASVLVGKRTRRVKPEDLESYVNRGRKVEAK